MNATLLGLDTVLSTERVRLKSKENFKMLIFGDTPVMVTLLTVIVGSFFLKTVNPRITMTMAVMIKREKQHNPNITHRRRHKEGGLCLSSGDENEGSIDLVNQMDPARR